MEVWRKHLVDSFIILNNNATSAANRIFKVLEGTISHDECGRCQWKCYDADLLHLECGHVLCFDCIDDQLERLLGFFERRQSSVLELYQLVLRKLLICSTCHKLYVLKRRADFHASLQSKDRGWLGRETFIVDTDATKMIIGHYRVWYYFENERRTLFGSFTPHMLFPFERPARTVSDGLLVNYLNEKVIAFDEVVLNKVLEENNAIWMEEWRYDQSIGNQQGWQYAFNWPSNNNCFHWVMEPSIWSTFVRRRRMLRVSITMESLKRLTIYLNSKEKVIETNS